MIRNGRSLFAFLLPDLVALLSGALLDFFFAMGRILAVSGTFNQHHNRAATRDGVIHMGFTSRGPYNLSNPGNSPTSGKQYSMNFLL
ncbi:MAG: hypothetical protein ACOYN0_16165, partial [Phycisphaerales bacterium]